MKSDTENCWEPYAAASVDDGTGVGYQGRLEDACLIIADCPHTTAQDEGVGFPLVRTPNVGCGRLVYDKMHRVSEKVYTERIRRAKPTAGDLIYAREAPAGNVALLTTGEEVCLGQRTVLIRPNPDIVNSVFLTYYLLCPEQKCRLLSTASGATVTHVNLPSIRGLKIQLPPLPIQQRIADILRAYDDLIENNRRRISLLEDMARELYREQFVRRTNEGRVVRLGEIAKFSRGKVITKNETRPGNVPVIAGGLEPAYFHDTAITTAPVVTVSGSGANAGYAAIYFENVWVSDCSWVDATTTAYPFFTYCFLKENEIVLRNLQQGAAQPHVYPKDINALEALLPNGGKLATFEAEVAPFFDEQANLLAQNRSLARQRDAFLPRLMSGKIDFGELGKEVS